MENKDTAKNSLNKYMICKVEEADTLLLKECLNRNSGLYRQFLSFEKQFNILLNKKFDHLTFHNSIIPNVGENTMIRVKGRWYRGVIEEQITRSRNMEDEAQVFLSDYGETRICKASDLVPIAQDAFKSVPYQAIRIKIADVSPVSLIYTLHQYNLSLKTHLSSKWDNSAKKFVEKINEIVAVVEFEKYSQLEDGTYYGQLYIELNDLILGYIQQFWKKDKPPSTPLKMSLSEILVCCNFAVWKNSTDGGKLSDEMGVCEAEKCIQVNSREAIICPSKLPTSKLPHTSPDLPIFENYLYPLPKSVDCSFRNFVNHSDIQNISGGCKEFNGNNNMGATTGENSMNLQDSGLLEGKKEATSLKKIVSQEMHSSSDQKFNNLKISSSFNPPTSTSLIQASKINNLQDKRESICSLTFSASHMTEPKFLESSLNTTSILNGESSSRNRGCGRGLLSFIKLDDFGGNFKYGLRNSFYLKDSENIENLSAPLSKEICSQNYPPGKKYDKKQSPELFNNLFAVENIYKEERLIPSSQSIKFSNNSIPTSHKSFDLPNSESMNKLSNQLKFSYVEPTSTPQSTKYELSSLDRNSLVRTSRVYYGGFETLSEEYFIIDERDMKDYLDEYVCEKLTKTGDYILRLQSYLWPTVIKEHSTVAIGGKNSGKTFGYIVPLISTLLQKQYIKKSKTKNVLEPPAIIICHGWENVRNVTETILQLSPPGSIKVISIWGALAKEEQDRLKINILGGSDILVATLPCLLQLINKNDSQEESIACAPLENCSYLVIDDADKICNTFCNSLLSIVIEWNGKKYIGEERINKQIIITSSIWSKDILNIYNHIRYLHPSIIISSHIEAAVFSQVQTLVYHLKDIQSPYDIVLDVLKRSPRSKAVVYTYNEHDLGVMKNLFGGLALYAETISPSDLRWEIEKKVYDWHQSNSVVLIVCDKPYNPLHHYILRNAEMIVHIGVPPSKYKFGIRYSVMLDYYPTLLLDSEEKNKSEIASHVILTDKDVIENIYIIKELLRIKAEIPLGIFSLEPKACEYEKLFKQSISLCHFVKAYGECKTLDCEWRHHLIAKDFPETLPTSGEVTLDLVKIIDASRYLVRLTEYTSAGKKVNLESFYKLMFGALQEHYGSSSPRKPLQFVNEGDFCAVQTSFWARGKVLAVDISKKEIIATVFLIDEGLFLLKEVHYLYYLPEPLKVMPQLITEVYLCDLRPADEDFSWTLNATNYISSLMLSNKQSIHYIGKIALSLKGILWLSPVIGRKKIEDSIIHQRSLKSCLLAHKYGTNNENHMKTLLKMNKELILNRLGSESCLNSNSSDDMEWLSYYKVGTTALLNFGLIHSFEQVENINEIGKEIPVEIGEIVSPLHFYVIKTSNIDTLTSLEDKIQMMKNMDPIEEFENAFCLAKFTDGRFYRGKVLENCGTDLSIFFIDHGETITLSRGKVFACPSSVLDALPPQAIRCSLDHITVGKNLDSATNAMNELVDLVENWNLKVNRCRQTEGGPIYFVELNEGGSLDSKYSLWRKLLERDLVIEQNDYDFDDDANDCCLQEQQNYIKNKNFNHLQCMRDKKATTTNTNFLNEEQTKKECDNVLNECQNIYVKSSEVDFKSSENYLIKSQDLINCHKIKYESIDKLEANTKNILESENIQKESLGSEVNYINLKEIVYKFICKSCGVTKEEYLVSPKDEIRNEGENVKPDTNLTSFKSQNDSSFIETLKNFDSLSNNKSFSVECFKNNNSYTSFECDFDKLSCGSKSSLEKKIGDKYLNNHLENGSNQDERFFSNNSKDTTLEISKGQNAISLPHENMKMQLSLNEKEYHKVSQITAVKDDVSEGFISKRCSTPNILALDNHTKHSSVLHPQSHWKQDNKNIYLKFCLPDVTTYDCRIHKSSIQFITDVKDSHYIFDENLYSSVNPDLSSINIFGSHVSLTLVKEKHENWLRLLLGEDRVPWLHKDLTDLNVSVSEMSEIEGSCENSVAVAMNTCESNGENVPRRPGGMSDDYDSTSSYSLDDCSSTEELFKFS